MNFSISQLRAIEEFFNYSDPENAEASLREMYRWYLLSDNDENGTIPLQAKDNMLFLVNEICKLLRTIDPIDR